MPDEIRTTLPPLPPDAGERTYILAAVRGALRWLPAVRSASQWSEDDVTWHATLEVLAPTEDQ